MCAVHSFALTFVFPFGLCALKNVFGKLKSLLDYTTVSVSDNGGGGGEYGRGKRKQF